VLSNDEIAGFFVEAEVRIEGNASLRDPQIEGHAAALAHFAEGGTHAVEQIPVGCGKTGLMAILPFGIARGRVLIIAPGVTIRDQIAEAVDATVTGSFYESSGVLTDLSNGPYRTMLSGEANIHDADEAHIVVTNIHQLAANNERWLPHFAEDYFDLILVDEGHHNVATSWQNVFQRFPAARVISLTATPFRSDEVPVEGEVIYRYSFRRAMERGYIKQMTSRNVAPSELRFTFGGDEHTHSLEEVLAMRSEDWYSRGVALAEESNVSIVDASIQHLNYLREGGLGHQLIAAACSMDHARQIRSLYEERGLAAKEIHSAQSAEEQAETLRNLRNGSLDVIVQVEMLGEGFDHPELSVAAVFRPFRSLSPYIQFIGRAMRVNVQRAPGHPDNEGIIVSHVGLNIDRHWEDFKGIDREDQELVQEWLEAGDEPPPSGEGGGRRRLSAEMIVTGEVVDRFLSDNFLDAGEDAVVENALKVAREQGLDLEELGITRELLLQRQAEARQAPPTPEKLAVQPQARREALRTRLRERTQAAASRILESLGQSPGGRQIAALGGDAGGSHNNMGAAIQMMHRAVNRHLGIGSQERLDQDIETLERGIAAIDEVADQLESELKERLDGGSD
jgi:DNA repair protein RadD